MKSLVYAVVTNCTYDGMCYDAAKVQDLLGQSSDRVHFDEAWYGYARFNPMYRDRHAMRGDPSTHAEDDPTVFATHSTHKLLAALSLTSFIHIRDGRGSIDHGRFNEAYCAQASTSPLYSLIASNEIAAAMMDGPGGLALTQGVIEEAVACRLLVARFYQEFKAKKQWFFAPWNADTIKDRKTGKRVPFYKASAEQLATDPSCWVLHPGEDWHGFEGLPDGYCLLDPIKFGIVCPGMGRDGKLEKWGIPADLRHRLPRPPRHRPLSHYRSHGALPVLGGRHERQMGHSDQHVAGLQGRLRPQCATRRGIAWPGGEGAVALRRHGHARPGRRDVGPHAAKPHRLLASTGV